MENRLGFFEVFKSKVSRKPLIISLVLTTLNQFTGIYAILFYCTTVFQESRSFLDPEVSNILFFNVFFISVTGGAFIVDNSGRRLLLLVSNIGIFVCLAGNATFLFLKQYSVIEAENFDYVELVALFLYIAFYAFGLFSVPQFQFFYLVKYLLPTC